jgi:hypothetical protein
VTSATRPAPVLSKVSLSNKRFRVARWNTPTIARKKSRIKKGTVLKYFLLEQADVTIEVQRAKSGRKSGKSCVKPSASLQNAKKCTRYLTVKTLKRKSFQGVTKVGFAGRVDGFKFPPGRYRFSLVGVNVYFQQSNRVTKSFTIVK